MEMGSLDNRSAYALTADSSGRFTEPFPRAPWKGPVEAAGRAEGGSGRSAAQGFARELDVRCVIALVVQALCVEVGCGGVSWRRMAFGSVGVASRDKMTLPVLHEGGLARTR